MSSDMQSAQPLQVREWSHRLLTANIQFDIYFGQPLHVLVSPHLRLVACDKKAI